MKFLEIFKDDNSWNEKAIIGFIAFAVMIVIMMADIFAGFIGKPITVSEYIYNSFLFLVLGSFGIAGAEKIFVGKKNNNNGQ